MEALNLRLNRSSWSGMIIATDPLSHLQYLHWAMENSVPALLDKPISTRVDAANNPAAAEGIHQDAENAVQSAMRTDPSRRVGISVLAHRRWHPLFRHAAEVLSQVAEQTGCPVTSLHGHHSDGQWRFPDEMLSQEHHSYHHGHGKLSHSGHHFVDMVCQWVLAGEASGKSPDTARISAEEIAAEGVVWQFGEKDYRHVFGDQWRHGRVSNIATERFSVCGEIDVDAQIAFRARERNVCLASLALQHNGVSQRAWVDAPADLYKGNGRIKHEQHRVHVGPFAAIHIDSFQASDEHDTSSGVDDHPGGRNHADLRIFRNHRVIGGKQFEHIKLSEMMSHSGGLAIEAVKLDAMREFLALINGEVCPSGLRSPLHSHLKTMRLISAIYKSIALGRRKQSRDVEVPW